MLEFKLGCYSATGARASTRDKRAWSGTERHASAPPRGLRLPCHSSASRPTGPPLRHHVPRHHLRWHHHRLQPQCLPGGATALSPFPFGMRNAATYASSSSTNFAEYEDLPGHHLLSIRNLIASPGIPREVAEHSPDI